MMYNKLSDKDKEIITKYIEKYAESKEIKAPLEHILRFWDSSKSLYLKSIFGDDLILSKRITYVKSPDEIAKRMSRDNDFIKFYRLVVDKLDKDRTVSGSPRWNMYDAIGLTCLASGKVVYSYLNFSFPLNDGKELKIQPNMKVMKIYEKLVEKYDIDKELFEKFRIKHSQFLNQKKLSGELCLSIHPMDFMTMSDNDMDWTSCMGWPHRGCYRRGTVDTMDSASVIVAYLKSDKDMHLFDDCYWNNKKWRCLFVVTNSFISSVKGYPYEHSDLNKMVIEWLKELSVKADPDAKWSDYILHGGSYFGNVDDRQVNFEVYFEDCDETAMYNDFGSVDSIATFNLNRKSLNISHCANGTEVCLCCGEIITRSSFDYAENNESYLVCLDCAKRKKCSSCEELVPDDIIIEFDGKYLCEYCYNDYTRECFITGQRHWRGEMKKIYIEDKVHHDWYVAFCDEDALNDLALSSTVFIEQPYMKDIGRMWSCYELYINSEDLTELGKEKFKKLIFN